VGGLERDGNYLKQLIFFGWRTLTEWQGGSKRCLGSSMIKRGGGGFGRGMEGLEDVG